MRPGHLPFQNVVGVQHVFQDIPGRHALAAISHVHAHHHVRAHPAAYVRRHAVHQSAVHQHALSPRHRHEYARDGYAGANGLVYRPFLQNDLLHRFKIACNRGKRQARLRKRPALRQLLQQRADAVPRQKAPARYGNIIILDFRKLACPPLHLAGFHARGVHAADHGPEGGAGNHVHGQALLQKNVQHTDMRQAPKCARAQRQAQLWCPHGGFPPRIG